jgi:hypothetical protein
MLVTVKNTREHTIIDTFNGSNLVNVRRKYGKFFMTYIQDVLLNLDTLHTCDESRTDIPQNP